MVLSNTLPWGVLGFRKSAFEEWRALAFHHGPQAKGGNYMDGEASRESTASASFELEVC